MSTIAVFIALGGTSYAVARNSVGGAQLKANAVTSTKVRNSSLRTADLAPSARIGKRGPRGPQGPAGSSAGGGGVDLQPGPWEPLPLSNTWGNYGGDHLFAAFRKDKSGQVHLRGLVTQNDGPPVRLQQIGILPPGYRPAGRELFATTTGNGEVPGSLIFEADGQILWLSGSASERDYTTLAGITFYPG
jgi:hypothetical protein